MNPIIDSRLYYFDMDFKRKKIEIPALKMNKTHDKTFKDVPSGSQTP